jgi:carboxylate-amine ligase
LVIQESRWRSMRYGCDSGLIDFGLGEIVPYRKLLDELIELVREDAEALGCVAEVENARQIPERGNSARRQVAVYEAALARGAGKREALQAVVDHLIAETALPA